MESPNLSPLSLAVAVATALLGSKWAPYAGAYGLIVFCWVAGVLIGLYRMPPGSNVHAAAFVVVSFVVTAGTTVPLAEIASDFLPGATVQTLLVPLAIVIPAVGMDWLPIGRWFFDRLGAIFRRKVEQGGPQQ